jgi:hypothetical protein
MKTRLSVALGSLLGALFVHVALVACNSGGGNLGGLAGGGTPSAHAGGGVTTVTANEELDYNMTVTATASCPSGSVVTGGACDRGGDPYSTTFVGSRVVGSNAYACTFASDAMGSQQVTATAICMGE